MSIAAPLQLSDARRQAGGFSFQLTGAPLATYIIQASTNLIIWTPVATNALPASGVLQITDPQTSAFSLRYYRAVMTP